MTTQQQIESSVDHLFRHQSGQMVATLTRILGWQHLDLIEDVVQDAFVTALRQWPFRGTPDNPRAWLLQVAKNRACDQLRRRGRWRAKSDEVEHTLRALIERRQGGPEEVWFAREIRDDQLRMVFACCDPQIPLDAQIALTLKTVSGFSVDEIARAFLTQKATIAQRIVRAKQRLRQLQSRPSLPEPEALPARLEAVLEVLYLLFNEGYDSSHGESLVRQDLCDEAIRLGQLLTECELTARPEVHALAALFHFQAARLSTRSDAAGDLLLLPEQDRSAWNGEHLRRGVDHLGLSARGNRVGPYHLQAEIASCHSLAGSWEETDWPRILDCYQSLYRLQPSPVVHLNLIIARAKVHGAREALGELDGSSLASALREYAPYWATRGRLLSDVGRLAQAAAAYRRASELSGGAPVRRFLETQASHLERTAKNPGHHRGAPESRRTRR